MTETMLLEGASVFQAEGEVVEAGSNRAFLLTANSVWLIASGKVDVFTVPLEGGQVSGARRHLLRLSEGDVLFGIDADEDLRLGLLVVGVAGTVISRMPFERIRQLSATSEHGREIQSHVMKWVSALSASIAAHLVPKRCQDIGVSAALPAG